MGVPKVSVVMPVKGADPVHVRDAVQSILGQSMGDLELVVVEDPSPRSSREVLSTNGDPRVVYVENREPTSHAQQINRAIALSRAEWIAHMDSDDVAEPRRLEVELAALSAHPDVDVVGSALTITSPAGDVVGTRAYPLGHDDIVRAMRRFNALAHSTVVYRKRAIVDAGGYSDRIYPAIDYSVWARVIRKGGRMMNVADRLVRYRLHSGEIKTGRVKDTIRASMSIKRQYLRDGMTLRDRVRLLGESALLLLPDDLVLRLFFATQYERVRS